MTQTKAKCLPDLHCENGDVFWTLYRLPSLCQTETQISKPTWFFGGFFHVPETLPDALLELMRPSVRRQSESWHGHLQASVRLTSRLK